MRYTACSFFSIQIPLRISNKLRIGNSNPNLDQKYPRIRWKDIDDQEETAQQLKLLNAPEPVPHPTQGTKDWKLPFENLVSAVESEEIPRIQKQTPFLKETSKELFKSFGVAAKRPTNNGFQYIPRPRQRIEQTKALQSRSWDVLINDTEHNNSRKILCADPEVERLLQQSLEAYARPVQLQENHIATLNRVQDMIHRAYSSRYRVSLFGSTLYGVFTPNSDLDMIILDPDRPNGQRIRKVAPIYGIRNLAKNFRKAGFTQVVAVPKAKVPIVKFYDPVTNLYGDINANERLGLFNSRLIKHYCDIQPLLRPMLAFIKGWAKPLGLNKPGIEDGPPTFSSYALTLMTIAFLQNIRLVPNLQDIDIDEMDPKKVFLHKTKLCHTQFRYLKYGEWRPPARLALQDALYGWFKFWSTEYPYVSDHSVDIKAGYYYIPVASTSPNTETEDTPRRKAPLIRLMDPFANKNVTKNIPTRSIERFRIECQRLITRLLPPSLDPLPSNIQPTISLSTSVHPVTPSNIDVDNEIARLRGLPIPRIPKPASTGRADLLERKISWKRPAQDI
ncbi:hypothetical protein F5050DRAFT_1805559 [Lentinula boryana]|uniref:Poly(A) RNA polymerase mitochondrial-like central palm domain-containing protein n=1 Tax=Lentinula boryana TaxID=40481 RepID=A0ABQ8QKF2_9AGAR|nr:hypothetical protein F5050DRAFT_1805559 [Lentinula boryana]